MAPPEAVYNPTTEQQEPKRPRWFSVPNAHLTYIRFCIKLTEVLFSFIAFILEELVDNCISCTPLYFFEFVSCTAFLFTSLLLVLLATPLHLRVGIGCWPKLDFCYTAIIGVLFLVAACILVGDNQNTSLELAASTMGFLSTAVFVVDVAVFWKTRGLPFGTRTPAESSGNTPVPEEEKLNTNGNANGPE